jgi:hypothetical protein
MRIAVLVPYGCRGEALGPKVARLFCKRGMTMSERGFLRKSQGEFHTRINSGIYTRDNYFLRVSIQHFVSKTAFIFITHV